MKMFDKEHMRQANIRLRWHLRNERLALNMIHDEWKILNVKTFDEFVALSWERKEEIWNNSRKKLIDAGFIIASTKITG